MRPVSMHDETADGHPDPDRPGEDQQQHHGRAAQVLGAPQQRVAFDGQRIGQRLDIARRRAACALQQCIAFDFADHR
ncbi:hypothetical protein G6F60_015643 [Rhizopus arrhizus]|nr:hypothetical protein G6F60_015643 [Rhizopus arrhizus]